MKTFLSCLVLLALLCQPVIIDHGVTFMWLWDWRFHGHMIDHSTVFAELFAIALLWIVTRPVKA